MTMAEPTPPQPPEQPPILGTWRNLYALVLGTWVALVVVFWIITQVYQ